MMVFLNIVRNTIQPIRYAKQLKTVNLCIIRTYARYGHVSRRPIAIVNKVELFESEDTTQPQIRRGRISARKSSKKKPIQEKKSEKIVSSLMSNLKSRKGREKMMR